MKKLFLSILAIILSSCTYNQKDTGCLKLGMSRKQVIKEFGKPDDVKYTTSTNGKIVVYFYPSYSVMSGYNWEYLTTLYFKNDKLIEWEE